MKKWTKILICLMLCVFGFGFVACDKRTEEEKNFTYPSEYDETFGNGGLAVRKDRYVYFVNGYKSVEDATDKKAKYNVGSILLMKLDEHNRVVTNTEGLLKDEYFITMSNKLCGYEATNLRIFGNYLYFTTPCLENESGDEVWAKERVVFNRIKLDKTGEVEEVYSSDVKYDNLEYEYYEVGGNLFILAYEKGESYYGDNGTDCLIRVNASGKSDSVIKTGVKDVVFSQNSDEIFYLTNESEKFQVVKYDIGDNKSSNYKQFDKTVDLRFVIDGQIYLTQSHSVGSSTDILVSNIASESEFSYVYAYTDTLTLMGTFDRTGIIAVNGKKISLISGVNTIRDLVEETEADSIKVVGFNNGCVVYLATKDDNMNLKMISYSDENPQAMTLTTFAKIDDEHAKFDTNEDNYLFFLKKVGENYYLHRMNIFDEKEEMFGVYEGNDAPEIVEEEEEVE